MIVHVPRLVSDPPSLCLLDVCQLGGTIYIVPFYETIGMNNIRAYSCGNILLCQLWLIRFACGLLCPIV